MKKLIALIILLLVAVNGIVLFYFDPTTTGNALFDTTANEREEGFVGKVIDGDTVIINGESVRLLGMDTAERGEPCYKEAKTRLEELVLNKNVLLERGVENKDQYKRLLRFIFVNVNGTDVAVNLRLVQEGLAIARFYDDKKYKEEIIEAEKYARENKIGCKWQSF